MLEGMVVGFFLGLVLSRMVGSWIAKEKTMIAADLTTEIGSVAPDLAKIKQLIAKL
jgi:hypothetical protein